MNNATTVPQQMLTTYPAPVVITTADRHPSYKYKRVFLGLGVTQVIIGAISIVLGGILTGLFYTYWETTIWTGVLYIVAGSLGIATGRNPNNCNVIGGMVMTILAAMCSISSGFVSAFVATYGLGEFYQTDALLHGSISLLAFVEFLVAVVHSSYCCAGSCCGRQQQIPASTAMAITTTMPVAHAQPHPGYTSVPYAQPPPSYTSVPHVQPPPNFTNYCVDQTRTNPAQTMPAAPQKYYCTSKDQTHNIL